MLDIDPWKHATFIYACWLAVGFGVGLLTLLIFNSERKQRRLLDELEQELGRSKR